MSYDYTPAVKILSASTKNPELFSLFGFLDSFFSRLLSKMAGTARERLPSPSPLLPLCPTLSSLPFSPGFSSSAHDWGKIQLRLEYTGLIWLPPRPPRPLPPSLPSSDSRSFALATVYARYNYYYTSLLCVSWRLSTGGVRQDASSAYYTLGD